MKFLILLSLVSAGLSAQSDLTYIYVMRQGQVPAERLTRGDVVAVKGAGRKWYKDTIVAMDTTWLQVGHRTYFIDSIEGIRTYNKLGSLVGRAMINGALLFASIVTVNGVINNDQPTVRPELLYWSGGTAVAGLLVNWLSRKTYMQKKHWYFKVIDYNLR